MLFGKLVNGGHVRVVFKDEEVAFDIEAGRKPGGKPKGKRGGGGGKDSGGGGDMTPRTKTVAEPVA